MSEKIKAYLRMEATVAAAFNFFISGMIAALIHHKADVVATDTVSIAVDLAITCLLTFIFTVFFAGPASIERKQQALLRAKIK